MASILSASHGVQLTEDAVRTAAGKSLLKNSSMSGQVVVLNAKSCEASTFVSAITTENETVSLAQKPAASKKSVTAAPSLPHVAATASTVTQNMPQLEDSALTPVAKGGASPSTPTPDSEKFGASLSYPTHETSPGTQARLESLLGEASDWVNAESTTRSVAAASTAACARPISEAERTVAIQKAAKQQLLAKAEAFAEQKRREDAKNKAVQAAAKKQLLEKVAAYEAAQAKAQADARAAVAATQKPQEEQAAAPSITQVQQKQRSDLEDASKKQKDDEAAVIESVKAASDILAPLDGEIVEVNEDLVETPGLANEDAMGKGWFFKIKPDDASQMDEYMDEAAYKEMIG